MVTNVGKDGTFPVYNFFFLVDLFWFEETVNGNGTIRNIVNGTIRNIAHL